MSQALDLAQAPRLVENLRRGPLPRDILPLIRLAAGCRDTLAAATASTMLDPDHIVAAAELYLRQVVCFPGADPHRTLGIPAGASRADARCHLRELVLWLHPDCNAGRGDDALMHRILEAWRILNETGVGDPFARSQAPRPERVSAYRPVWISRPVPRTRLRRGAVLRPWVLRLLVVAIGLAVPCLCMVHRPGSDARAKEAPRSQAMVPWRASCA